MLRRKIKQGKGIGRGEIRVVGTILDRVAREGVSEEITFEQS